MFSVNVVCMEKLFTASNINVIEYNMYCVLSSPIHLPYPGSAGVNNWGVGV